MNKRQKIVQEAFLENEEAVIRRLKQVYNKSLEDITKKVSELQAQINAMDEMMEQIDDPEELARIKSMKQSKVYQKQYQDALKKQVNSILDNMQVEEFKTVEEYLNKCYEEGFLGTMYDLQGQGIPLCFPMDQAAMVRAVQLDSKISQGLYTRLGEDVSVLKNKITAQVSRGISTGMSFKQVAQQLAGYTNIGFNNAVRIARTEGHRIQVQSTMDACYNAKEMGADVVKQWDASLDKRTRPSHQKVDGEIREIDEPFSNGLMFPGDPAGGAKEVINCRCALLQRARWALDDDELEELKKRAEFYGLDKADSFDDFKKKYLKAAEQMKKPFAPAKTIEEAEEYARNKGVKYADYRNLPLSTANELNKAIDTLPDDIRPVFVGASNTLEQYWGGSLPRKSKHFYGVSIDVFDGIHLGYGKGIDFDTQGKMIGISSSYKTANKITEAKKKAQEYYRTRHNGHSWFFNENGETTPYHEVGHVYVDSKGLPNGFEESARKWAEESKCDMLLNPNEAWAEAWASYHTGINKDKVPDEVLKFIEEVSKTR